MNWKIVVIGVIVIVVGAVVAGNLMTRKSEQKLVISETGSTLLYPVFNAWAKNYTKAIITTQATGSGAGIAGAIAGTVVIGASDAYMTDTQVAAHPNMLNIPILISAQYVAYNIPGLNNVHIVLSGPVIAGIYNNTIQYWNASQIKLLNPNITLPHKRIIPVYRSDGSGDTNMFTLFLSRADSWWNSTIGFGTNVNWPSNSAAHGAVGNAGIVSFLKSNTYSIGYVAMTYTAELKASGLGYAALLNRAGKVILPSITTMMNAANQYLKNIPADGRISIAFAPGVNSYPIVTLEYVIVNKIQSSQKLANGLKAFLTWIVSINGGSAQKYLTPLYLAPLPATVVSEIVVPLINQIKA